MADEREILTWDLFGTASRELAQDVADDGFEPDIILAIARGGLLIAGALGYALERQEPLHDERRVLHRASTSGSRCR